MYLFRHFVILTSLVASFCANSSTLDFKADYYERDLKSNSIRGTGNAWLKSGNLQIWANEIEYNFNSKIATAIGDVNIKEDNKWISSSYASYELNNDIFTVEDALVSLGQTVLHGEKIIKKGSNDYIIINGYYSNCNVNLYNEKEIKNCQFDWQVFGSRIYLTMGGYAHIYDALGYAKDVPLVFTPYLIIPVKYKRETGFLFPYFRSTESLGSGIAFPFFLNLGEWHDIFIVPTIFSKAGYHISNEYSYSYSREKYGNFNFTFTQRKFLNDITNTTSISENKSIIGEWSIKGKNVFNVNEDINTYQSINYISHPYYSFDYYDDVKPEADMGYLKSQFSVLSRNKTFFASAKFEHNQSLTVSKDIGCDNGAVTEAPSAFVSYKNTPLIGNFLSYDWDIFFSNYVRKEAFDQIPLSVSETGQNIDDDDKFDENDFIRTGRRLRIEPKIYLNLNLSNGAFFQPVFKFGGTYYNFDFPNSSLVYRHFFEVEAPLSFYFLRRINFLNEYKISHVFQPVVIYSVRPLQTLSSNHPFFCQDPLTGQFSENNCQDSTENRANPRFDMYDLFSKYEYMRFELVNRFRYKDKSTTKRALFLKLSQQFNIRTFANDPRFSKKLGPIELVSELNLWKFILQLQASYDLETTLSPDMEKIRESTWSGSLFYSLNEKDNMTFSTYLKNKADKNLTQQSLTFGFYKNLSSFLNIGGGLEYSLKKGEFLGYSTLLEFYSKPRSCWFFSIAFGRTTYKQSFARFDFKLYFGGPGNV